MGSESGRTIQDKGRRPKSAPHPQAQPETCPETQPHAHLDTNAEKKVYRLVAFDLDGTVLDESGRMSPGTLAALAAAGKAGAMLAVVTGRAFALVPRQIVRLPYLRYIASDSGAVITRCPGGQTLQVRPLEKTLAQKLVAMGKAGGAAVNLSLGGRRYFEWESLVMYRRDMRTSGQKMPSLARWLGMMLRLNVILSAQQVLRAAKQPVLKVECVYPGRAGAARRLRNFLLIPGLAPVLALGGAIEITARGATKGQALSYICQEHGILREEVLAFGDSGNDVSMQDFAGCFVAVGNATADLKAVADHVAETVHEDGVAKALRALMHL